MALGGRGLRFFILSRNCEVSRRNDGVVFTKGVRIFSRRMDKGERIESVDATMGRPGGFWSLLCTFGSV